ncbi:hypothetical protein C5167_047368 [Papaver somniferum]|uniref:Uncharacterized protein n=1 Tax=Papaver somniferum TaxID=3469 RepID=A0A4Y7LGF8_PAPSO|nr:hypothetical protein C5167_047368 [Papaver somniferum]
MSSSWLCLLLVEKIRKRIFHSNWINLHTLNYAPYATSCYNSSLGSYKIDFAWYFLPCSIYIWGYSCIDCILARLVAILLTIVAFQFVGWILNISAPVSFLSGYNGKWDVCASKTLARYGTEITIRELPFHPVGSETIGGVDRNVISDRYSVATSGRDRWPNIPGKELDITSAEACILDELPKRRATPTTASYLDAKSTKTPRHTCSSLQLAYRQQSTARRVFDALNWKGLYF